jgi:alkylhydroperoxidase family enzyme
VLKRGHVSDADVALLRVASISDAELLEIVGNTVLNILTNYINNAVETEIDFPRVRAEVEKAA